jgi:hypothetical protein
MERSFMGVLFRVFVVAEMNWNFFSGEKLKKVWVFRGLLVKISARKERTRKRNDWKLRWKQRKIAFLLHSHPKNFPKINRNHADKKGEENWWTLHECQWLHMLRRWKTGKNSENSINGQ